MSPALVSPRTPRLRAIARSSLRLMPSSPRTLAACTAPFENPGAAAGGGGGVPRGCAVGLARAGGGLWGPPSGAAAQHRPHQRYTGADSRGGTQVRYRMKWAETDWFTCRRVNQ